MREALAWLCAAIILGVALAALLVLLIAPARAEAAGRPYTVYRTPRGCLYITTNPGTPAMVYVPDVDGRGCDGAIREGAGE